jgi:hypothetical protein
MHFEICFLDRRGRLSCLMLSSFRNHGHAADFARHVMDTAACRKVFASAEIHADGQRLSAVTNPTGYGRAVLRSASRAHGGSNDNQLAVG